MVAPGVSKGPFADSGCSSEGGPSFEIVCGDNIRIFRESVFEIALVKALVSTRPSLVN